MCIVNLLVVLRRSAPMVVSECKTATPDRDTYKDWDSTAQQATAVRVINHKPRLGKSERVRVPSSEPVVLSPAETRSVE